MKLRLTAYEKHNNHHTAPHMSASPRPRLKDQAQRSSETSYKPMLRGSFKTS